MSARVCILILAIASMAACRSDEGRERYERIARTLRPIRDQLRAKAKTVLTREVFRESDYRDIVDACTSEDDALWTVNEIDFIPVAHDGDPHVELAALSVVDERSRELFCRSLERCARHCVTSWTRFVLAVEALRVRAVAAGVHDFPSVSPYYMNAKDLNDLERIGRPATPDAAGR